MNFEQQLEIDELYQIKHRRDVYVNPHFEYEDNILKRTTSPYIWNNPNLRGYLEYMEQIQTLLIQKTSYLRNFYYVTRGKYDTSHCR
jgi:hypothetical protein